MNTDLVPQEGNATLGGQRKVVYARDAQGRMVIVPSQGWEAEEIVTRHAVETIDALANAARERGATGLAAPLEYWMHARRMDIALLAQASGFWQWQVRRHLRPAVFAALRDKTIQRYADALGLAPETLKRLPA